MLSNWKKIIQNNNGKEISKPVEIKAILNYLSGSKTHKE